MDRDALQNYNEWIGKTPEEIIKAVKAIRGGWATVFPEALPLFAHQVRNFFNVEPISLTRYDEYTSRNFLAQAQAGLNVLDGAKKAKWLKNHKYLKHLPEVKKMPDPPPGTPDVSTLDDIAETFALSGDVYKDNANNTWFQMSPGGTIYHWGKDPVATWAEAPLQNFKGQAAMPIFKLVSPDGTGGSSETIIENLRNQSIQIVGQTIKIGRFSIGEVNKKETVFHLINTNYKHQGSYNYSETVSVGIAAHKKHDVHPHEKYPKAYVNPPNRFQPLSMRKFPARNAEGKLIGYEPGFEPFEFDTTRPDPPTPTGAGAITDALGEAMAQPYPPGQKGYLERFDRLKGMFQRTSRPKRLLGRIQAKSDKAAQEFYKILKKDTEHYLLQILRNRPQGGPKDVWP